MTILHKLTPDFLEHCAGGMTIAGKGSPFGGGLSPEVTERARTLTEKYGRIDNITLTKGLLIAVRRLYRTGLALSVIASQCHLSQRERLQMT